MVYFEKMGRGAHQVPGYIATKKIVSIRQCPVNDEITDVYMVDGTFVSVPGKLKEVYAYIINEGSTHIF